MKRILITGANSYIGTSLEKWLAKYPEKYFVNTVSTRNNLWKQKSYSESDVVFHVAGIAHVSSNPKMEHLYYEINRDLAIEVAKKAKMDGVKQFIFMSSIIVYGDIDSVNGIIDENTVPKPSNCYGNSKLQAEECIKLIESNDFKIVILRPPMIYGKGSKGNYPKLSKAAQKFPIFPNIDNKRSMLHIDNLCEFIKLMIDNEESGLFFPQNKEYVDTSIMVKLIAEVHGKKIILTKIFNPIIKLVGLKCGIINKVFGNLLYKQSMSCYDKADYQIRNFRQSVELSESE